MISNIILYCFLSLFSNKNIKFSLENFLSTVSYKIKYINEKVENDILLENLKEGSKNSKYTSKQLILNTGLVSKKDLIKYDYKDMKVLIWSERKQFKNLLLTIKNTSILYKKKVLLFKSEIRVRKILYFRENSLSELILKIFNKKIFICKIFENYLGYKINCNEFRIEFIDGKLTYSFHEKK